MDKFVQRELSGWGNYLRSSARVYRAEGLREISTILERRAGVPCLARGLGRSYGDAALNQGGKVILLERLDRFLSFDSHSGRLVCEAGVTLEEALKVLLPRGWFLPVTPGTQSVSLGGAVACDVHGKNHHRDGSFSSFVLGLEVLLADGRRLYCSPQEEPDLFWATMGGMGLTGIVLEVTLQLRRVETAFVRVHYRSASNLEQILRLLEEADQDSAYSVAWVDGLAQGRSLGRGIVMDGDHATLQELTPQQASQPLEPPQGLRLTIPLEFPHSVLNRFSVKVLNWLCYGRWRRGSGYRLVEYRRFFYHLDSFSNWNRAYGKRGFIQYQCVLPWEAGESSVAELLDRFSRAGIPLFLVVLKRFGAQEGLLSFPMPGYTLALDLPMLGGDLLSFLEELDRWVAGLGGRVYLAKDATLSAQSFRAMYPRFRDWLRVKERVDPQNVFSSDLSRRLKLESGASP